MTSSDVDPRPIVVGVDSSDSARDAAEWAADLAAVRHCPLRLVHVVHGCDIDAAPTEVPEWLREVAAAAVRSGAADTEIEIASGGVDRLLLRRGERAALLVVGSYGEAAWTGMLAGSTGLALVGHAPCPVAVIRGSAPQLAPPRGGPVVVGADSSASSVRAVDLAAELAAAAGAEVLAVHAFTDVSGSGGAARRAREGWGTLVAHAESALDHVVDAAERRHPGVHFRRLVVAGTALNVLIEQAVSARMVVVGQRDERVIPTGPMVLGSTSRGLVEFAPCPVVVARAAAGRDAEPATASR